MPEFERESLLDFVRPSRVVAGLGSVAMLVAGQAREFFETDPEKLMLEVPSHWVETAQRDIARAQQQGDRELLGAAVHDMLAGVAMAEAIDDFPEDEILGLAENTVATVNQLRQQHGVAVSPQMYDRVQGLLS